MAVSATPTALPGADLDVAESGSEWGRAAGRRCAVPIAIGSIGFLLAVAFSWVPSIWYDESATVVSITRSWPQLFAMLQSVDAVHGLYYVVMHLWIDLVGYTPFTLRLPSAIATGLSAGLTVILVRQLATNRLAIISGVVFCLLPRVTWMGAEGRSYAATALLAIVLTLVFVAAWRRSAANISRGRQAAWWLLYALVAVLATTTFVYLALVIVGHGVTAVWTFIQSRKRARRLLSAGARSAGWSPLVGFASAAALSGVAIAPLALEASRQSAQVSWISPISLKTLHGVFVSQWFIGNLPFALVGCMLAALTLVLLLVPRLRARLRLSQLQSDQPRLGQPQPDHSRLDQPQPDMPVRTGPAPPTLISVVAPWLLVPTFGLIAASAFIAPLYSPRYVTDAVAAIAILMAIAIDALRRNWQCAVVIALCAAVAAPQYIEQRTPAGKPDGTMGTAWSEIAAFITAERVMERDAQSRTPGSALEGSRPTEAIIYGPLRRHPSATTRAIAYSYPDAFAGLIDVTLRTPAAKTGALWETRHELTEALDPAGLDRLNLRGSPTANGAGEGGNAASGSPRVVWLVTSNRQDLRPEATLRLGQLGYHVGGEWAFTAVNVVRYER